MLKRLQQKWKVSPLQLALVLFTFAIGGSLTGYVGRKLLGLLKIDHGFTWVVVYLLLIVLLWPLMVIIVSIPFGQFRFFLKYIRKIGVRMRIINKNTKVGDEQPSMINNSNTVHNIAIFASGAGSNAQKIIDHFRNSSLVNISLIVCNNPRAGVLNIAEKEKIPTLIIEKEKFFRGNGYTEELKQKKIEFIILAGFLWKLPSLLLKAYPQKIINIHPALLPKYGGKGMYGHKIHEAVLANKEKESGITIHYVDEIYDHGQIIFQEKCSVLSGDTADSLAQRIHELEHQYYSIIIEQLISNRRS